MFHQLQRGLTQLRRRLGSHLHLNLSLSLVSRIFDYLYFFINPNHEPSSLIPRLDLLSVIKSLYIDYTCLSNINSDTIPNRVGVG